MDCGTCPVGASSYVWEICVAMVSTGFFFLVFFLAGGA